ncbi:O-antigen ligase family protein [Micromonospora sp. WMMC241]|uniref:O-antigen ligase family protein n=1 Tax=Micromonospora sp. WMMC241 TaxID=3015159 RepID=UPI0022B5F741|nr:O-antigen ligase family protein [Micromonospora sp. WMMC241]MCZ7439427.1 O-antigen ligase family protein [Micromonospora sp. WMMC241]
MRVVVDTIKGGDRRARYLGAGLVVLAAGFLLTGRWQLALGVGVGALLGWVLSEPVRITWAVFVVAFAVPVTIDPGYPTNPSYTLLLVLFVLAAWGRVLRAERDGWPPRALAAVLVLPTCAVLAGLVHWHGAKPVVVGVAPLLCFGVLGWHLVEEARHDRRTILRIAEALTWFSVAVALFAKYQTVSRTWPIFDQFAYDWTYTSAFDATRAVGISGHPIIYGTFAMAMALVALTVRGRFWYVPVAANLAGLVLSGTRSAWVGMILALGCWLFFQWRRATWRGLGGALAIAAVAGALVAVDPSGLLPTATDPTSTAQSTATPAAPASSPPAPASSPTVPASGPAAPPSSPTAPASSPAVPASSPAVPPSSPAAPTAGSPDSVDVAGSRISDPASADARFTRISVVWAGITHDWSTVVFGNGPEANVRYLENVGIGDGQAQVFDNTYLTFWYNFGLIGLACLLAMLVLLYRHLRSLPARLLLVAFAAQIFFFDVWLWLGAVAVLLLAVALGAADDRSLSARTVPAPGPRRPEAAADDAVAPDARALPGRRR